jgi:ribosomal protein S1
VDKPSDVLKIGQEITSKVVELNTEDKKISLSIKAMETPENEQNESEGSGEAEAESETEVTE